MMYGIVSQWQRDKVYFPASFDKAFAFLDGKDVLGLPAGRYDIDGDTVFALVQDVTMNDEMENRFEAHAKYADIQLILSGTEKQLYAADGAGLDITEDKYASNDVAFFSRPENYNTVILTPWSYAVYPAGELHCPNCAVDKPGAAVRKIVFKVAHPSR